MFARAVHRRCLLAAMVAALATPAMWLPMSAVAADRRVRLDFLVHGSRVGSGKAGLSFRVTARRARRIEFLLDGHRLWIARPRRPAFRRRTVIDTHKLRNGRHVVRVRVMLDSRRSVWLRRSFVVRNSRQRSSQSKPTSTPPAATPPVVGPPATTSPGATTPGTAVANFNRETYSFSTAWSMSLEASRYQFMVLQGDGYGIISQLKALNPNLKVLLYQSPLFTNQDDPSDMPTDDGCTSYSDDMANHPGWFLRDQNGNLIVFAGMPGHYLMDIGNPAYQQTCAANAAALAKQLGFDGVFLDNVSGQLSWLVNPSVSIPAYSGQGPWDNALSSAIASIPSVIAGQGLLTFGNVAGAPDTATWEQWVSHLDGVEEESWTDGGLGLAQQVPYWSQKLTELAWAEAHGKYEIVHSYNATEPGNTYGLASMLLATAGNASYSTSNTNYTSSENWFPEYSQAQALGAATGSYTVLANGVYQRQFERGIVLVNPTDRATTRFSLGGGSYAGSGLTNVQSVQMPATSGLILLRSG